MKYKTSAAFRRALEEGFRQQSLEGGQPLTRLRKIVAFDRFLARLAKKEPEAWIVQGGFALQLRLGTRARTTKDIDGSAIIRDLALSRPIEYFDHTGSERPRSGHSLETTFSRRDHRGPSKRRQRSGGERSQPVAESADRGRATPG